MSPRHLVLMIPSGRGGPTGWDHVAVAGPGPSIDLAASRGARRIVERPGLFERLASAKRAILVSAPAGSGKTSLLRSWIAAEALGERTAWVTVEQEHNDPLLFCLSVQDALRATLDGARVIRGLSAAPGLESPALVNRLLEDLSSLERPLWLVIDDLHELQADDAIHQLELLLAGAPTYLRLVLLTRRDPRLGLHRLRLDGELTEIRFEDLRFTLEESRTLLETAGVHLSEDALGSLVEMTEGWVTGLRLAALSLARHPDPEGFATGFSGRDRAVAEYLVAEVLEQQPKEVSRLLLRTSVLRRVSGPLADRLTSGSGSERILWELEDAGAFVVAVDPDRRWFRYHRLFADLLELELRRTAPADPRRLHVAAAQWFSENGHPVEAVRHAQTAEDWTLAARLLFDSALALYVGGQRATVRELLSQFPPACSPPMPSLRHWLPATTGRGDRWRRPTNI
jgi:LuxR family maltose regulon positive regulatory protein